MKTNKEQVVSLGISESERRQIMEMVGVIEGDPSIDVDKYVQMFANTLKTFQKFASQEPIWQALYDQSMKALRENNPYMMIRYIAIAWVGMMKPEEVKDFLEDSMAGFLDHQLNDAVKSAKSLTLAMTFFMMATGEYDQCKRQGDEVIDSVREANHG